MYFSGYIFKFGSVPKIKKIPLQSKSKEKTAVHQFLTSTENLKNVLGFWRPTNVLIFAERLINTEITTELTPRSLIVHLIISDPTVGFSTFPTFQDAWAQFQFFQDQSPKIKIYMCHNDSDEFSCSQFYLFSCLQAPYTSADVKEIVKVCVFCEEKHRLDFYTKCSVIFHKQYQKRKYVSCFKYTW